MFNIQITYENRARQSEQEDLWHFVNNHVKFQNIKEKRLTNQSKRRCGTSFVSARSHRKWLKRDCFLAIYIRRAHDTLKNNYLRTARIFIPLSAINRYLSILRDNCVSAIFDETYGVRPTSRALIR